MTHLVEDFSYGESSIIQQQQKLEEETNKHLEKGGELLYPRT
jgi:hypothetical protein